MSVPLSSNPNNLNDMRQSHRQGDEPQSFENAPLNMRFDHAHQFGPNLNHDNDGYMSPRVNHFSQEEDDHPFSPASGFRDQPPNNYQQQKKHYSPSKTAGQVIIRELQPDDVDYKNLKGRDAVVIIEGEMRQFENKKFDKVQKYVESLVTGNFMRIQKDINLQLQSTDAADSAKKLQSNRQFIEQQMKQTQRIAVNRVNKLFNMFLGLLAGMSLMHLISILSQSDKDSFLQLYSPICNDIALVFMIFTSFGLILSLALTLIYRQKSDEKMRNMDIFRLEFRQHYIVSLINTIILSICMILIYIIPKYSNTIYFVASINISDGDISIYKGLFIVVNVLLMISWLIASAFNKASITDMDLDPEEEDNPNLSSAETNDSDQ